MKRPFGRPDSSLRVTFLSRPVVLRPKKPGNPPSQAGISPTPETLRLSPGALPCASAYLRPSVFIDVLREQLAARLEWLKRSAAFLPCFQRDHAGSLLATVKAESDHIAARIEAAGRLRNARKPWQPRRGV